MVFGRDISAISIAKLVNDPEDVAKVDLACTWFVTAGNIRKVDLPNMVDVIAEPFDHVPLGNLHVVDVEQNQHPWTPNPVWPENSIYLKQREIIPGVVDNETTRCQSAWTRSVSC